MYEFDPARLDQIKYESKTYWSKWSAIPITHILFFRSCSGKKKGSGSNFARFNLVSALALNNGSFPIRLHNKS